MINMDVTMNIAECLLLQHDILGTQSSILPVCHMVSNIQISHPI
jgi:hypothetical protein